MEKIALVTLISIFSACANIEGTQELLGESGYGELTWMPAEENVCVAIFTDEEDKTRHLYLADRITATCDRIPAVNYFEVHPVNEKATHLKAINVLKSWMKKQRATNRERQNELVGCIVADRSTIIYGSSVNVAEDGTFISAKLSLRSSECPISIAEMALAPDGSFDIYIAPFVYPID
jgi:hypothetical protein